MASPLRWFRRNQKQMLVVFGVLLMVAFLLPAAMTNLTPSGSGQSGENKTVVEWTGGKLTEQELHNFRVNHFQTLQFLDAVMRNAQRIKGAAYQPRARIISQLNPDASPEVMDRQIVLRYLLAKKGAEMGLVISDGAVMDYVQSLADDPLLTTAQLDQLAREVSNGQTDFLEIERHLKFELMVANMDLITGSGLPRYPNLAEAWDLYSKMHRRIECQVLELPVNDFLIDVTGQPSNSELRAVYEQGKYDYPDPLNELPGFKQRKKVAVEYLTARLDDFVERHVALVTPEQVEAEYQRMVEAKDPVVMEVIPPAIVSPVEDDRPPRPPRRPSVQQEPANASEQDGTDLNPPKTDDGKREGGEGGDPLFSMSGLRRWNVIRGALSRLPVSIATLLPPAVLNAQQATPSEQNQQNDPAAQQSGSQQDQAASPAIQEDLPPIPPNQPGPPDLQQAVPLEPERRVRPLSEVADEIKRRLASAPARTAMRNAIQDAQSDVADYGVDYHLWQQSEENPGSERVDKPDPLDPQAIADKYKLIYGQTGLVDEEQLAEETLGQINVAVTLPNQFGQPQTQPIPLAIYLLAQFYKLGLYQQQLVDEYFLPNQHIVWFSQKEEPKVLDFAEARPAAEQYWKYQQALQLAEKRAESIVGQLESENATLKDKYPNQANDTGEFTWYNSISLAPSAVPGTKQVGDQFMTVAYNLQPGQAAVAVNDDRSAVYVVQLTKKDEREDAALYDEFFNSLSTSQGMPFTINRLYARSNQEITTDWLAELEKQYGVKWLAH